MKAVETESERVHLRIHPGKPFFDVGMPFVHKLGLRIYICTDDIHIARDLDQLIVDLNVILPGLVNSQQA